MSEHDSLMRDIHLEAIGELEKEIARLTDERDSLRERLEWWGERGKWYLGRIDGLQADLAAAQAALEYILPIMEGYPKNTIGEALYLRYAFSIAIDHVKGVLSCLGTGEALAAVREAIAILEEERLHGVAARLKAVFPRVRGNEPPGHRYLVLD